MKNADSHRVSRCIERITRYRAGTPGVFSASGLLLRFVRQPVNRPSRGRNESLPRGIIPGSGERGCCVDSYEKLRLESRLESLCEKGCRHVWQDIDALERGEDLAETQGLTPAERRWLLSLIHI